MGEKPKNREAFERTVKRVVEHNKATGEKKSEGQVRQEIQRVADRVDREKAAGLHADKPQATVQPVTRTVRAVYNIDPKRKKWF